MGELVRGDIVTDVAGVGRFGDQGSDHLAEVLLRSGHLLGAMEQASKCCVVVSGGFVGDQRVPLEHGRQPLAHRPRWQPRPQPPYAWRGHTGRRYVRRPYGAPTWHLGTPAAMTMTPRVRRLVLAGHVIASVGWLGAVAAFVGLAAVGLTSDDAQTVRGVYLVMEPAAWFVLLPFAFASLVTGLVQALGSPWGLFRHYWVVFKLLINVVATVVLVIYMDTFDFMAAVAADPTSGLETVRNTSPLLHAGAALLLLLVATLLGVYKPRGLTPFGHRARSRGRTLPVP